MGKPQDSPENRKLSLELSLSLPGNPSPSRSQPPPQPPLLSNPPPLSASPAPPSPNPPPPSSATSAPPPLENRKLCLELSLSLPNPTPSPSSSPSSSLSLSQPPPQPPSHSNSPPFSASPTPPSPNPPPPSSATSAGPPPNPNSEYQPSTSGRRPRRARRPPKPDSIEPEYEWATNRRATVYSLNILRAKGIEIITGEVECRQCGARQQINYDLEHKFREVKYFIMDNMWGLHSRAPPRWMNPAALNCNNCAKRNCVKPLISPKKRGINWLFLLLGQMLGYCKLTELKYFCKHTKNHRTGAKDRLLYDVYVGLCKQLDPEEAFEI